MNANDITVIPRVIENRSILMDGEGRALSYELRRGNVWVDVTIITRSRRSVQLILRSGDTMMLTRETFATALVDGDLRVRHVTDLTLAYGILLKWGIAERLLTEPRKFGTHVVVHGHEDAVAHIEQLKRHEAERASDAGRDDIIPREYSLIRLF